MNEADIARSIGQNAVTAKSYRVLLQMMFLTFDVRPWFRNIGKRLVKSGKGYIIDTSLLCHLQQINLDKVVIHDPHVFGHILENFVASELVKQLASSEELADLFHSCGARCILRSEHINNSLYIYVKYTGITGFAIEDACRSHANAPGRTVPAR